MRMELLSPAGNEEALIAAVQNGADAVYLGGKAFGARAAAANFDGPALEKAVAYCPSARGSGLYDREHAGQGGGAGGGPFPGGTGRAGGRGRLSRAGSGPKQAVVAGLSGHLPACQHPDEPEQCRWSRHGPRGLGLRRVVAARECSLEEIAAMAGTGLEVEVFAHGALCRAFRASACFPRPSAAAAATGGAAPSPAACPYWLGDSLCYALSTKDLCCLYDLPALMRAGACSIKLEGRLKRPEYVAVVTRAYRQALDLALEGKKPGPGGIGGAAVRVQPGRALPAAMPFPSGTAIRCSNKGPTTKACTWAASWRAPAAGRWPSSCVPCRKETGWKRARRAPRVWACRSPVSGSCPAV